MLVLKQVCRRRHIVQQGTHAPTAYCLGCDIKTFAYSGELFEGTSVVKKLVAEARLQHSGRVVVTDNYYSSMELQDELRREGLYHMGVLRSTRVPEGESWVGTQR